MSSTNNTSKLEESSQQRDIKISCRNVWKVYGENPSQFFQAGRGKVEDPRQLHQKILEAGHVPAACDVSFDVHAGELLIIMGLSGSGKSTMVRSISRLVESTAGEVLFDGQDLLDATAQELREFRRHKMGMVFQNFGLLPHQTVVENIAFPLKVQGVPKKERETRAHEVLELVGLKGRENSFPHQLSGGQQQRVGIARSLAVEPDVWFLDEPFSALDPLIRRQMQDEFLRLQRMLNKTIVFITHDFLEALRLADRIVIMKDGWVQQIGTPAEVVMNPATEYVREFTQDVPRMRVITAGEVLEPLAPGADPDRAVQASITLEELIPHFANSNEGIPVVDSEGNPMGMVTERGVVKALAHALSAGEV